METKQKPSSNKSKSDMRNKSIKSYRSKQSKSKRDTKIPDEQSKRQTIFFKNPPYIISSYSIVSGAEGEGNLGKYFDKIEKDDTLGQKSYERAERKLLEDTIERSIAKANLKPIDVDILFSGDLLNQIISATFAARKFGITYLGLYSACATIAESLAVGSCFLDSSYFDYVCCATSSHFSSAERQYRFPLELGNQRPPTSQWTVTGAGSYILATKGKGPRITSVTFGKVVDYGIKDVNNMGGAMAPAAMSTLKAHLRDSKTSVEDYDLIVTGDLGKLGSEILVDLAEKENIFLDKRYMDCGAAIYNSKQQVFMGGSGAGCSATVLSAYILPKIESKVYKKVLFMATGALLSTTSSQQGDTIPCVAHAIVIEGGK